MSMRRDILDVKERYKDSIDIRLAYEVDFRAGYLEDSSDRSQILTT